MLSPMAHLAKAYPSFLSMKQIEILLPPPNLDGMLIYHKVTPPPPPPYISSSSPDNPPVLIYTSGWKEAWWQYCAA